MANDEVPGRGLKPEWVDAAARTMRDIANAPPLGGRFVAPPPVKRIIPAEDAFKTLKTEMEAFEANLD